MFRTDEKSHAYRHGDHGPKYLQRGPYSDIGVVVLQPGQSFPAHRHERIEESFLTIEGEVHMYVDGTPYVLKVGDFLRCETGEFHYVVNRGDVPWKAVFIKSPYDPTDSTPVVWVPSEG